MNSSGVEKPSVRLHTWTPKNSAIELKSIKKIFSVCSVCGRRDPIRYQQGVEKFCSSFSNESNSTPDKSTNDEDVECCSVTPLTKSGEITCAGQATKAF